MGASSGTPARRVEKGGYRSGAAWKKEQLPALNIAGAQEVRVDGVQFFSLVRSAAMIGWVTPWPPRCKAARGWAVPLQSTSSLPGGGGAASTGEVQHPHEVLNHEVGGSHAFIFPRFPGGPRWRRVGRSTLWDSGLHQSRLEREIENSRRLR